MRWGVLVRFTLIQMCFGDIDEDFDTPLYVDQDDQLNDSKTKLEVVTHGRYDEVFSEYVFIFWMFKGK